MGLNLNDCLVVGISSRALFDLEQENEVYLSQGVDAYRQYQLEHEQEILRAGSAFPMIQGLLKVNELVPDRRMVEVVVMSKNSPDTGLRIFNSIQHYGLDITRAAFGGGKSLQDYLEAFHVDLFLSKNADDVQGAIDHGVAAAQLYDTPKGFEPAEGQVRIAFDGDAVLFSEESEQIFKQQGLEAFIQHEKENQNTPMMEGPFAKLLKTLSFIQKEFPPEDNPFRLALVTARSSPTHTRVVNTLRAWNVYLDEAFFLGGVTKEEVLKAFRPHIFFDDQDVHLHPANQHVPSAKVPYRSGSALSQS